MLIFTIVLQFYVYSVFCSVFAFIPIFKNAFVHYYDFLSVFSRALMLIYIYFNGVQCFCRRNHSLQRIRYHFRPFL